VGTTRNIPEKIILATGNRGKVKEIRDLVADLPISLLSLNDIPDPPEVLEDGATFEENALKKARETVRATGIPALADDSGLCVDALDGRPGVLSARYAGDDSSDESKYRLILQEMRGVPEGKRTARFVCVLALVYPDGEERIFRGVCEGRISREPRGRGGFGYDPIFLHEDSERTFAEIGRESKNRVSHRGRALALFAEYLRQLTAC
jgi:XTP/dITP diphosphohydrolase